MSESHEHRTPEEPVTPVTPGELLRQALVDDADPRFPRWLPLPGILLASVWAAFQAATTLPGGLPTLFATLMWPGAAIFAVTTLAAWFGWQLEID